MAARDGEAGGQRSAAQPDAAERVSLLTIAREWGRIGCIGFGGPPAHIALLRELCVARRRLDVGVGRFEDGSPLPTCCPVPPRRSSRSSAPGACAAGRAPWSAAAGFILPGLVVILALAALFLGAPPRWVRGAAAGAGAAVAAVALHAGMGLLRGSRDRAGSTLALRLAALPRRRGVGAATLGPWLVLVLVGCGLVECCCAGRVAPAAALVCKRFVAAAAPSRRGRTGGLGSLVWVAFKVGALSFGGGFVIIPLMQNDAVNHYHWMTRPSSSTRSPSAR